MGDGREDRAAVDALDRVWEALLRSQPAVVPAVEPALAETVRRVHALPDVPGPEPSFVARVERELMAPQTALSMRRGTVGARDASSDQLALLAPVGTARFGRRRSWWRALEAVAAAALVVAISAGLVVGWGLRPGQGEQGAFVPAPALATPGTAVSAGTAMERGNAARTGEVPGSGPANEPDLLWRAPIGDQDGSTHFQTPLVVGDSVYLGASQYSEPYGSGPETYYVFAMDARTGAERWRAGVIEDALPADDRYVGIVQVAIAEGTVFVGTVIDEPVSEAGSASTPSQSLDGEAFGEAQEYRSISGLVALDAATGSEKWRVSPDGYGGIAPTPGSNGLVYLAVGGEVLALDAATGQERWRAVPKISDQASDDGAWIDPIAIAGETVVFGHSDSSRVYALDALTGAERWRSEVGGGNPVITDGSVFVSASDYDEASDTSTGSLRALDLATGTVRWEHAVDGYLHQVVVGGGVVVMTQEEGDETALVALDAATGQERWSASGLGYSFDEMTLAAGVLYFGTFEDGLFDLGPLSRFLGVEDASYLHAIDAASGNRLWRIETELGSSAPAVGDGMIYVEGGGGDDRAGTLFAYGDDG